jgi:3',5'-cyclic AMP phosphodiesterase CpdA
VTTIALEGGIARESRRANRCSLLPGASAARVEDHRSVRPCLALGSLVLAPLLAACAPAATSAPPAAPSAAPARAEVWAVGDADTTRGGRRVAATVRAARPDLLLYLGDVYETGTATEFRTRYDPLYGALARRTLPTPGNHEWGNRDTGYRPYWRARQGRPIPDRQQRRIGGWEILSLNSQAPSGPGSAQLAWLRRAAGEPGTCRIAIWHRPRWSSGWHGDQRDLDPLWRALRGRARLVLSGHDHDLQRFADRDGLRQLVAGAGGRPNVPLPRRSKARVRYVNRFEPGAARLRLAPGTATIDLVAAGGRVLDRSRVTCRPLGR